MTLHTIGKITDDEVARLREWLHAHGNLVAAEAKMQDAETQLEKAKAYEIRARIALATTARSSDFYYYLDDVLIRVQRPSGTAPIDFEAESVPGAAE